MCKGFRRYRPACLTLKSIVAYGASRIQAFFEIAGLKQLAQAICVVRPQAGETVCLQFLTNRQSIRLRRARALAHRRGALRHAEERLDMMADLVR
ncbi:MAG TPA: hypothetical protein VHK24_04255, partial [Steroidobacter sp.]|nr:hypothetical protein [Steroidobacter sp.]